MANRQRRGWAGHCTERWPAATDLIPEVERAEPTVEEDLGRVELEGQPELLVVAARVTGTGQPTCVRFVLRRPKGPRQDSHGLVSSQVQEGLLKVPHRKVVSSEEKVGHSRLVLSGREKRKETTTDVEASVGPAIERDGSSRGTNDGNKTHVGDGEVLIQISGRVEELDSDGVLSEGRVDDAHVEQNLSQPDRGTQSEQTCVSRVAQGHQGARKSVLHRRSRRYEWNDGNMSGRSPLTSLRSGQTSRASHRSLLPRTT